MTFTDISKGGLFLCNGNLIHSDPHPAMIAANRRSILGLTELDGSLFSVESFRAGSRTNTALATGIDVVGVTGAGSVFEHFSFSGGNFSSFVLDPAFTGLSSLRITATGNDINPQFLINDIVVNEGVPGGVPEPASWALMISGFGLTGAALRRRRSVVAA